MTMNNPHVVRRSIMEILYASFQNDPLQMLAPADIVERGPVTIPELVPNAHYLHDRKLIEMMMGYTPPLFAAARIAPEGIDLFEDAKAFDLKFPEKLEPATAGIPDLVQVVLQLMQEAEATSLEGRRRDWLLNDIDLLRADLAVPKRDWNADAILSRLEWLDGFFDDETALPSLVRLRELLQARLL
jgi:hypothetical protein